MNRKRIRDHRRIPLRFRFTSKIHGAGITTWPKWRDKDGDLVLNPGVHVSAVITKQGKKIKTHG